MSSLRVVQSASWQSVTWRVRELSSNRATYSETFLLRTSGAMLRFVGTSINTHDDNDDEQNQGSLANEGTPGKQPLR